MSSAPPSTFAWASTLPADPDPDWIPWERRLRVVAFGVVTVLVVLGSIGLLGVRTAISAASKNGYSLEVTYAAITRAGLATPLSIVITRDGAEAAETVTVEVTSDYLALLDDNGMEPLPSSSFNTTEWTSWVFELQPGETELRVDLDARLEPAVQVGKPAVVRVLSQGAEVVSTHFATIVMP